MASVPPDPRWIEDAMKKEVMKMEEKKLGWQCNLSDHDLNVVVAKLAGYWIYHYDKDVEAHCYYMLCLPDTVDSVVVDDFSRFHESGWHAGERKTEADAWNDVPHFTSDLNKIWPLFQTHNLNKRGSFRQLNYVIHCLRYSPDRAARNLSELFVSMMEIATENKAK